VQRENFTTQKIGLLLRVLIVLIITITVMVVVRLVEADYTQATADILFLLISFFSFHKLKKDHTAYKTIVRIVFFAALMASLFLLRNHPDSPVRFIWFSTIVYLIYYLFERKEAFYWISGIGVILLGLYFGDMRSFALSVPDFFIWILNMLIILMISHWYAQIEEESTNRLLETQKNLAQEVDKKTQELEACTRELEILNEQLEERVAEEVQKNRNQEQMLFMQARYAQMGEVLSMIAHQWRQPLNAVSSSITTMQVILRSGDCNIEALSHKTKRVEGYVQHLSKTIDDFRNFFREDKEKCHLTLCDIVHDAMNLMYPLLKEDHISIEIGKECRCTILSYPNEILHVVLNILSNARDVLLHQDINKKYIHINMYDDETHAYLEIEDWGGGIDEEIIEKIFDPYFTTKEENGGTGLGLYMSKLIIERHCRGRLSVENTSKGARFKMSFPIVAHHLKAK
jgi:signal transduction histidine kinase